MNEKQEKKELNGATDRGPRTLGTSAPRDEEAVLPHDDDDEIAEAFEEEIMAEAEIEAAEEEHADAEDDWDAAMSEADTVLKAAVPILRRFERTAEAEVIESTWTAKRETEPLGDPGQLLTQTIDALTTPLDANFIERAKAARRRLRAAGRDLHHAERRLHALGLRSE